MTNPDSIPSRFLSTTIPYVNAPPHLGFALEAVITDALGRYWSLRGWDVHRQTGTDDNSLKNARAAAALGLPTAQLVDRNAARFAALRGLLDLDFTTFVRTSGNPQHRAAVEELWARCAAQGDVYRRTYRGLYCVGCEQFYSPEELVEGRCPEHDAPPELVEEQNYFFRLSRYQEALRRILQSGRIRIVPEERRHEVSRFIEGGLVDFSISRSRERAHGWGLPVPGDPTQVIYVWFDALANYVSALGYSPPTPEFDRYWGQAARIEHVIGKGVLRFHAVYWPAILLSAGVRLPTDVLVHGYVTVEGRKIGKSLGNAIDPFEITGELGVDAVRYFLLRHIHTTRDGDFSRQRLIEAHDGELADQLGNLVHRTISLLIRYRDGQVPEATGPALGPEVEATAGAVADAVNGFALHRALDAIFGLVASANRYVDATAPWRLAAGPERDLVLYTLADTIRCIGILLLPFLPASARELLARLGQGVPDRTRVTPGELPAGARVVAGPPLFSKLGRR
jgi:methionyl-tRNA synthetase